MVKIKTIKLIPSVIVTLEQYYELLKAIHEKRKFIIKTVKGTPVINQKCLLEKEDKIDMTLELELEW